MLTWFAPISILLRSTGYIRELLSRENYLALLLTSLLDALQKTRIYHPNITEEGNICMGILKADQWKPSTRVEDVLRGLHQLLLEPNPDDPLIPAIADQYKNDNASFKKEAQEQTKKVI